MRSTLLRSLKRHQAKDLLELLESEKPVKPRTSANHRISYSRLSRGLFLLFVCLFCYIGQDSEE